MNKIVDTHAHLEELENVDESIEKAKGNGIIGIIAVGSNHQSNENVLRISEKHKSFVYPALGLHPWDTGNLSTQQLDIALAFIHDNLSVCIGVGEVGLDYHKKVLQVSNKELQKDMLMRLCNIATQAGKPVIVHSRYAWKDALNIMQGARVDKAVFHWYTGSVNVLQDIIATGYYISATPAAEYHEEHRRAIKETPVDRLLLETDCPVLYGRETRYASEPVDVTRSLKAVSALKDIPESEVAVQTTHNAARLFGLSI